MFFRFRSFVMAFILILGFGFSILNCGGINCKAVCTQSADCNKTATGATRENLINLCTTLCEGSKEKCSAVYGCIASKTSCTDIASCGKCKIN